MEALKEKLVTPEMARNIRNYYLSQGVHPVELIDSDVGTLVPPPDHIANKFTGISWRRWKLGNGFIATCGRCNARGEFEEVTEAGKKKIRFQHCGKADKMPWLLRLLW